MTPCPPVDPLLAFAWSDLTTCRSMGMSLGPIPWTAFTEWADRHDLIGPQRRYVWSAINIADGEFLKVVNKPKENKRA